VSGESVWKIVLLLFAVFVFWQRRKRRLKLKTWPRAEGTVVGARTMGDSSRVDIRYMTSDKVEHLGQLSREYGHSVDTPREQRIPYTVGQELDIIYSPENPSDIEILQKGTFSITQEILALLATAILFYWLFYPLPFVGFGNASFSP
jgi:hypothetical protein